MARPGVTYLDVSNAAQQLLAAGRTPTIETIRIALGTGSNSTLGLHLRTWKAKQDQAQQISTKENIPEELIAALKGVWERVINQSEDRIQTIQRDANEELAQLKQEMQHLKKEYAVSQQQYQQCKQERDGLIHEKLMIEQLHSNAKIEIATLTEKIAGFEHQNHEKQARVDELHRQNRQIQANLEHYRTASVEQRLTDQQRYEQQQNQLEQTIQQITQEMQQTKQQLVAIQQKIQHDNFEHANLRNQLDKMISKNESIELQLKQSLEELVQTRQDQQQWKEQYQDLLEKYNQQNNFFLEIKIKNAVYLKN